MRNKTGLYIVVFVLLHWIGFAQSIPELISYQGVLSDGVGQPLTNTIVKLAVNIYDEPTGGNKVWGPQIFDAVMLQQGRFNVILGPIDTDGDAISDAFADADRYLGITIAEPGGDITQATEMAPRQRLLTTPYAFQSQALAGDAVTVDNNGNVGIGTTSPWEELTLAKMNNSYVSMSLGESAGAAGYMHWGTNENQLSISTSAHDYPILIGPTGVGGLFVDTDVNAGNIGIGTTSPEAKLHVEGTIEVDQKIQANDSGGLELATDEGATRLFISDNGYVGIGTTNPSQKLDVNGAIKVNGLSINDTVAYHVVDNGFEWDFGGTGGDNSSVAMFEVFGRLHGDANNASTHVWIISVYGDSGITVSTVHSSIPGGDPAISITRSGLNTIRFSTNNYGIIKVLKFRRLF